MPIGPQKIILIHSGRYEYAEVEIDSALQIVGPNNTGKTTLINALQFLYLNDRRHMDFGSYTADATREFYFPDQYSYMLFECLGPRGHCVIGWRGQSKTSGGEPERFCFSGRYDEKDFLEQGTVREPSEVSARLSGKNFRLIKSAQEHAELLLSQAEDGYGVGIVSLRDPEKYYQFRETLKCLLTLSTITQEQMRDRLLMMADIPPARTAINERTLFGDDYDRIRERRDRLMRFKKNMGLVEELVKKHGSREGIRGQLIWLWDDLRLKRKAFEAEHAKALENLRAEKEDMERASRVIQEELEDRRAELTAFAEEKGGVKSKLDVIVEKAASFADYAEELGRAAISNLSKELLALRTQLGSAQSEQHDRAAQKVQFFSAQVSATESVIARYDHLAVTALRRHFSDEELNVLFQLLSRDLLELPVGTGGIELREEAGAVAGLRELLSRVKAGVYEDSNVRVHLKCQRPPLSGIESVEKAREQLQEHRESLAHWETVLSAIEQREKLAGKVRGKEEELDAAQRRLFAFGEYQKERVVEPVLREKLEALERSIAQINERVLILERNKKKADSDSRRMQSEISARESAFANAMSRFGTCLFPTYESKAEAMESVPDDFDATIAIFLKLQEKQIRLSEETDHLLAEVERWFGEEFRGDTETETLRLLREELEALAEKESALAKDWNQHIHGLKASFDRILKELGEVRSARDDLNRYFGRIQVSNLKAIRMEVVEQSDLVSWIKRLATFEPGDLFESDPERESALVNFRTKLQDNPVIRFADLFTLGVTVEGPDGRKHTYHDFRQVESHGTTIAIKVLFNLLLLKSQLKRDDCQVPFFLDEIQILDPSNRNAILATARKLGFLPITAAPEPVSEVDALYFLQPKRGWIVLRNKHRVGLRISPPQLQA